MFQQKIDQDDVGDIMQVQLSSKWLQDHKFKVKLKQDADVGRNQVQPEGKDSDFSSETASFILLNVFSLGKINL